MGYCRAPTLTSLGMLRPEGTEDVDEGTIPASGGEAMGGYDEGLGIMGTIRRSRARARRADPRRALALMTRTSAGRFLKPTAGTARASILRRRFGITAARRGGDAAARAAQMAATRRAQAAAGRARTDVSRRRRGGIFGRMRARTRAAADRARAAQAERAAAEAAAIAEAERLARETVTPPPVTDRNGQRWRRMPFPPTIGTRSYRCDPRTRPPNRPGGVWQCIRGNWSFQGIATTMPVLKRAPEVTNGAPAPEIPTARPWWQERPRPGDADPAGRDTSGIPTPPGLPGGPSMRPPPSGRDTATEVVEAAPAAAGPDMAKLLPLAAAAAFMFLR